MTRKFKQARLINNMKMTEAAGKLGISQPTLSAWEGERKSPSIDGLENMADLYGTTTDYLLGRAEHEISDPSRPIPQESLLLFHEKPVWSAEYGWMLVNAIDKVLLLPNGQHISFPDAKTLYATPLPFSEPVLPYGTGHLLELSDIRQHEKIWVEPISPDSDLRAELRGWYHVKERHVQNEYGNNFYLDTYGSKWLAFTFK